MAENKGIKKQNTRKKPVNSKYTVTLQKLMSTNNGNDPNEVKPPRTAKERAAIRQVARDRFARHSGIIFIALLVTMMVINLVTKDVSFSAEENRLLQEKPKFSISEYFEGRFETKLENYFNDQFAFRHTFIKVKSATDITAGKLEANDVFRARDRYLMEGINVPTDENLAKTEDALSAFRSRYEDVEMYFLLAPNAANILEDKLPRTVRMANQDKLMDGFFASIKDSGYKVIDVRDAFEENSKDIQLYYRTDHHWTTDGAYIAYLEAANVMELPDPIEYEPYVVKNDFNGTLYSRSGYTNGMSDEIKIYLPVDKDNYVESVIYYADSKEKTTEFYQLDNLETKDAYSVFGGSNHPMYTIKTPIASNEKLLLVKDSYANSFIPFLSQYYREIVVVDPRYFYENIDDLMASEGVTEVMFLYNANTFFADESLSMTLVDNEANGE